MAHIVKAEHPSNLSSLSERVYCDPSDDPEDIPWYLFRLFCACPCDKSSTSDFAAIDERCPSDAGHDVSSEINIRRARRAAKATLLIVALFSAVAQWSAIASGVNYYEKIVGLDPDSSSAATSATIAVCFLVSILGGVLSDAWLGTPKVLTIGLTGAFGTSTVLAVLAFPPLGISGHVGTQFLMAVFLFLFAASCGLVQTAVPSLVGDQCHHNPQSLSNFYNAFYAIIQFGAFLSRVLFPIAHRRIDWFVAIAIFMVLPMAFALFIYTLNMPVLTYRTPTARSAAVDAFVVLFRRFVFREDPEELEVKYGDVLVKDAIVAASVLRLHLPLPIFWALYFQIFSLWFLQAKTLDLEIFSGVTIQAEQATAMNPFLDVILLAAFTLTFKYLSRQHNINVSAAWKIFFGYFFAIGAFAYAIFLQVRVTNQGTNKVSVWFQMPQYVCICAAEVLVYPAALHQAYVNSPISMRSFVQSCLWFFIGVGNTINAIVLATDRNIGGRNAADGSHLTPLFIAYAAAMVGNTLFYIVIMIKYDNHPVDHPNTLQSSVMQTETDPSNKNFNKAQRKVVYDSGTGVGSGKNFLTAQDRVDANEVVADRRIRSSSREGSSSIGTTTYHSLRKSPRNSLLIVPTNSKGAGGQ